MVASKYAGPMNYPANNWMALPADFLLLVRDKTAGVGQALMLLYIGLRTWGTKAPGQDTSVEVHWALITIDDFVRELKLSPRQAAEMLADAIARGLVAVKKIGRDRLYQLTPQNWKTAPDYEPAADEPAADEPAADEPAAVRVDSVIIAQGKTCRPMPLHLKCRGIEAPVEVQFFARNEVDEFPLEIVPDATGAGRFGVTIRKSVCGERKANDVCAPAQGSSAKPLISKDRDLYRDLIKSELLSRYHHPFSDAFLADVMKRVDGAPFDSYKRKLSDRQERAKTKRETLTHQVLLWVADDVGELHRQLAEMDREVKRTSKPLTQMTGDELRDYLSSCPATELAQLLERYPSLAEMVAPLAEVVK